MSIVSVTSLIDVLRDSGLLDAGQQEETRRLSAQCGDPRELARQLLQKGWLTPYQVNQLFQADGQQLVLGPYILMEKLGSGGMGQVFKARHRLMKRIVALKVIRKDRLGDANSVTRFLREIEASAQLAHPNIVTAYDADQVGDTLLLAMEYVQGTDLAGLVKQNGPLPVEQACAYARQAAMALQHAHERGLVHRDIKPHNLLVSFLEGKVKVLDMGLARLHGSISDAETTDGLTQTGAVMGTPDYISPEQARHARVDIRSDIYSLGCSLYFMLSGRVPFTGKSLTEKLLSHQLDTPTPIDKLRPEVPLELGLIVERMMAKKPEERFQTPGEAAQALEPFGFMHSRGSVTHKMIPGSSSDSLVASVGRARQAPADLGQLVATAKASVRRNPRRFLIATGSVALLVLLVVWLGRSNVRSRIPPRERFSWQPKELVCVLGQHRVRHSQQIQRVVYSPDGKLLATSCGLVWDKAIRLWDADTRQEYKTLSGHKEIVHAIAIAGDNRTLISGGADNLIKVWDLQSGNEITSLYGHKGIVTDLCFAPDGRTFVSSSQDGTVRVWTLNVPTSRHAFEFKGQPIDLAVGPDGTIALAIQKDGKTAAIQLWSLSRLAELGSIDVPERIQSVGISVDGRFLACGHSSSSVKLWSLPNLVEYASVSAYASNTIAFAPTGDVLAIGGGGQARGEIILWNVLAKQEIGRLEGSMTQIQCLAFSSDRNTLASGSSDGVLQLWDLHARKERQPLQGYRYALRSVAFTPDGKSVAAGDDEGTLTVWDLDSLSSRNNSQVHRRSVYAIAFSHDGKMMASGDYGGTVRLWEVNTFQIRATIGDIGNTVQNLKFTAGDKALAVGNQGNVQLRDLSTRKPIAAVGKYPISGTVLADDGNRVAVVHTDVVRVYDLAAGTEVAALSKVSPRGPAVFSKDGSLLAISNWDTNNGNVTIRMFEIPSGKELPAIDPRTNRNLVHALAFHPQGKYLVASDSFGRIIFLNPLTGEEKRQWYTPGGVNAFAFNADGSLLATANGNGTVYVYRLEE